MEYTIVLEVDEEGGWLASVPAVHGRNTWCRTRDEAVANAKEAIEGCLESLAATNGV